MKNVLGYISSVITPSHSVCLVHFSVVLKWLYMHALTYVQSANLKLVSEFPYNIIISQSVVATFAASKSIHVVAAHAVTFLGPCILHCKV